MNNKLEIYNIEPKKKYKLTRKFYKLVVLAMLTSSLSACGKPKEKQNNDEYHYEQHNKEINNKKENKISNETIIKNNYSSDKFNYYQEKDNDEDELENKPIFNDNTTNEINVKEKENITPVVIETKPLESKSNYDQQYLDNIANMNINLNSKDISYLYNYIDEQKINYPYEDLFEIDSSLLKYNDSTINNKESISSINFSLYDIVKKNNKAFLYNYTGNKYKNLSDSLLMKVCDLLTESINNELKSGNVKVPNIEEKLKELKILDFDEFTYAFYNQNEGLLGVSLNAINSLNKDNAFNRVIYHEGKHIVQASYNKNPNIDMQFGFQTKYNNLKVNSLFNEWFYETSAEQLVLNQTNDKEPIVYDNGFRCFETIKVATLLNDNNDINTLENLTLQSDINELYKYFNCQNDNDIKEILNMMFAYNILISTGSNTTTGDFYNNYIETFGKKMDMTEQSHYGYELNGSISSTLTKVFYKDLLKKIDNKQVNLNEVFSLISIFEIELNKQCRYYENTKVDYLRDFYINYTKIQEELFEVIANNLNLSVDEIKESYNNYFKKYNYNSISLLNNEKNNLYQEIYDKDNGFKEKTINYYKDLYYGENINIKSGCK